MVSVTTTELRKELSALLKRVETGEEIRIMHRGEEVARLVPPAKKQFPDLTEFRQSIKVKGEPVSETVIRQRREARY